MYALILSIASRLENSKLMQKKTKQEKRIGLAYSVFVV